MRLGNGKKGIAVDVRKTMSAMFTRIDPQRNGKSYRTVEYHYSGPVTRAENRRQITTSKPPTSLDATPERASTAGSRILEITDRKTSFTAPIPTRDSPLRDTESLSRSRPLKFPTPSGQPYFGSERPNRPVLEESHNG
jgi:hypothetical protein